MRRHGFWFNPLDHIGLAFGTLVILGAAGVLWFIAKKAASPEAKNKGLAKSVFAIGFIALAAIWVVFFALDVAGWLP